MFFGFSSLGGRSVAGRVMEMVGDVTDNVGDESVFLGRACGRADTEDLVVGGGCGGVD